MSLLETVKSQIQIIDVVEQYTEFRGGGNRLRARQNPLRSGGDFDVYHDTQKYYDHGTGEGGDIIDFIQAVENLDRGHAISFLSERFLNGANIESNHTRPLPKPKPIKDNPALMESLKNRARKYLAEPIVRNGRKYNRYTFFTLEMDGAKEVASLDEVFIKLFEASFIEVDESRIRYIFDRFIGYDPYFNCPAIILYDYNWNVVNIIRYRPSRGGYTDLPKYLYLKAEEKPDSDYLYPFQFEMERMILKNGFAYVGEGLKNAIVALAYGIPYISIESSSNVSDELVRYLRSSRWDDMFFKGAFDGDQAGERAYKKINAKILMQNKFNFDSGQDFAEYVKEEYRV